MLQKVDFERLLRGHQNILVEGVCDTDIRRRAIEDAVTAIQTDGKMALLHEYIGVKNYAAFGDQREDHEYLSKPSHGVIVFGVGRKNNDQPAELGLDEIYYLEAARDFGGAMLKYEHTDNVYLRGLSATIDKYIEIKKELERLSLSLVFLLEPSN